MATRTISVKQGVDIWSLGCIYSEAAIWIADGYRGLLEYRRQRKAETDELPDFRGGDCFHDGHKVLDVVANAHANIEDRLRKSDHITKTVLDTMVDEMLWIEDRPKAKPLLLKAEKALQTERRKRLGSSRNEGIHMGQTRPDSYPRLPPVLPNGHPPPPWLSTLGQYPTRIETLPQHENWQQDNQHSSIISREQSMSGFNEEISTWQQHTPLPLSYISPQVQRNLTNHHLPDGQLRHWQGLRLSEQQTTGEDSRGRPYLDPTSPTDDGRSVLEISDSNPYFPRDNHAIPLPELEDAGNSVISNLPRIDPCSQPASPSAAPSTFVSSIQTEFPFPGSRQVELLTPPTSPGQRSTTSESPIQLAGQRRTTSESPIPLASQRSTTYESLIQLPGQRSTTPESPTQLPGQRSTTSESTMQAPSRPHKDQDRGNAPVVAYSAPDTQAHPSSPPSTLPLSNKRAKPSPVHLSERSPQVQSLSIAEALEWKRLSKGMKKRQSRMQVLPGAHLLNVLKDRDHVC
jgi:hypothetical protein